MAARITHAEVVEKGVAFYASLLGSLVACFVIHMIAPMFDGNRIVTIGLVITFFGCLSTATWALTEPYESYLRARYSWAYGTVSQTIRNDVHRLISRQARVLRQIGIAGTVGVGFMGLAVGVEWGLLGQAGLQFQNAFVILGLLGLLGMPILAVLSVRSLREAAALRAQIREQVELTGARLRTAEDEARDARAESAAVVETLAPMRFRAGGYNWHWGDFYKNAAIFGQSGTGKTLCVLNATLDGLIGSSGTGDTACSALILDPKGDFRNKIKALTRKHGRSRDLLVLDPYAPERSYRWNPLDSSDDALEIAGRFGAVMETLSPSGADDTFWIENSKRLVQHLIVLLRAVRPGSPPSLVEIQEAAMSDAVLDRWGKLVTSAQMEQSRELTRTISYFFDEWKTMPEETRGSVRSFVGNMLNSFLITPYDELFSGPSDLRLGDIIDQGKILYVYMPIADREVMAKVVSTFLKLEFYREVLKRPDKRRPSLFLCDEFQSFFTVGDGRGDADAFARTRQSNHANVIAFQNINALLKQADKPEPVLNLLGNCAIKIFLRNTDRETNEYASKLFGQHIETLSSTSYSFSPGDRRGAGTSNLSGTDSYMNRIKEDEFTDLSVPSREEGIGYTDTIAHLAARSQVTTERLRWKVHPIT